MHVRMERPGVEVSKQRPHERVLAEDLGGPFPQLNRGNSDGRRTHTPNGRGAAREVGQQELRMQSDRQDSSGGSRTGRTVLAAAIPEVEPQQDLGDPAHIRTDEPRTDLTTAAQGSRIRPMAMGLYETDITPTFWKQGSNICEGHGGGCREASRDPIGKQDKKG